MAANTLLDAYHSGLHQVSYNICVQCKETWSAS